MRTVLPNTALFSSSYSEYAAAGKGRGAISMSAFAADVAGYSRRYIDVVRRSSGLVQSGWLQQSASFTSWPHG